LKSAAESRIIEPCSKYRSLELLKRYFGVSYSQYLYERLPKLLDERERIEKAVMATAKNFQIAPFYSFFMPILYWRKGQERVDF